MPTPPGLDEIRHKRVVVLPDLYVDALAFLPPWHETKDKLDAIAARGGGNLPIGPVEFKLGGNAANLALALARLGAQVELIAETDALGAHLLERAAQGSGLGTSRVRIGQVSAATLGLECKGANLMLSHAGPVADFGPERLDERDWALLEAADVVAMVNWAQNRQGTRLLRALAQRLGREGVFVYVDCADPSNRIDEARDLIAERELWPNIGAFAMNENELRAFSRTDSHDLAHAARTLATRLGTRVDVHTRAWAATATAAGIVEAAALQTPARRLTGAGDAWNAGNIAGHLLGWPDAARLEFAHRVATAYVTGEDGKPPTAEQLLLRAT